MDGTSETAEGAALKGTRKSNATGSLTTSGTEPTSIAIDFQNWTSSVAFFADGEHVVGGDKDGKIRCFKVEDGNEMGAPLDAGDSVWSIAVSRDGKWIVAGTRGGQVMVWDAESREKVIWPGLGHATWVGSVDISPDSTKFATGSRDKTARLWSLSPTVQSQQLRELEHNYEVHTVKFSPDGHLFATGSAKLFWTSDATSQLRIYDGQNGQPLVNVTIGCWSLAWASDSKQLFALSFDGNVRCLDVFSGAMLSQWLVHGTDGARCISMSSDGAFVAVSVSSSVSFWDTSTRLPIGPIIHGPDEVYAMAISRNYDLAISGGKKIILRDLCGILPSPYVDKYVSGSALKPPLKPLC